MKMCAWRQTGCLTCVWMATLSRMQRAQVLACAYWTADSLKELADILWLFSKCCRLSQGSIQRRVQNPSSSTAEYITFYNVSPSDYKSWLPVKCSTFCAKNTLFHPLLHNNIKNIKWHLRQENIHPYSQNPNTTFFFSTFLFFTHNHTKKFYQEKRED